MTPELASILAVFPCRSSQSCQTQEAKIKEHIAFACYAADTGVAVYSPQMLYQPDNGFGLHTASMALNES
jgi:hypothetical protein